MKQQENIFKLELFWNWINRICKYIWCKLYYAKCIWVWHLRGDNYQESYQFQRILIYFNRFTYEVKILRKSGRFISKGNHSSFFFLLSNFVFFSFVFLWSTSCKHLLLNFTEEFSSKLCSNFKIHFANSKNKTFWNQR